MVALSRRRLLTFGGATTTTIALGANPGPSFAATPTIRIQDDAFQLGVASGEPAPDSVVLWTRLAPDPINGGGMPNRPVSVEWEIAHDERFQRPIRSGSAVASPDWGHSVHVEPDGLRPDTVFFYRFRVGTQISPVGRTRTTPSAGSAPERLRFAYASCQDYQDGYYTAHADLAEQDLDFVVFLGDYIYETKPDPAAVRTHEGDDEPYSLVDYRNRYARYRTDPHLQTVYGTFPWFVTLDDHEVDNDWAATTPQDPDQQPPDAFLARRAAAFQAWYEHMPVRSWSRPRRNGIQIYRRFGWGDLARVHILDTRQYRTDQAKTEDGAAEPDRTMLGRAQKQWLFDGLQHGSQHWNLVANQVPMNYMPPQFRPRPEAWLDPWDGYLVERQQVLDLFGSGRVANPFVVTGDRHFTMACDLKSDFTDPESATVSAELVGTSISSEPLGGQDAWHTRWDPALDAVEHWKYGDGRRGYVICDVDRERALSTLRVTARVDEPGLPTEDAQRFVVESGKPGLELD